MQAATIQTTAATPQDSSAPKYSLTGRLIALAGLSYLAAEILYMYSHRHIPGCNCMPMRLILPQGEPRLLIGACLLWIVSGGLLLTALIRIARGLLSTHPLKWACSLLSKENAAVLHAELAKCIDDPTKRPNKPTRAYATDALIFLGAAAATFVIPVGIQLAVGHRSPEGDAFAMIVVSCVASGVLTLEGLRRATLFLYAWRRAIVASVRTISTHLGTWLSPLAPFRANGKRPACYFNRRQLVRHVLWSVALVPIAHAVLLVGALQFPPNGAGQWYHRNLILVDSLHTGPIVVRRLGVDRLDTVAMKWNEIRAYAEDPDCGAQPTIAGFLWYGPRWYFRKAWDVSVDLSEKRARALGWTKGQMEDLVSRIESDRAALATTEEISGDEIVKRVEILDKRFVFTSSKDRYSISCNGLDCDLRFSGKSTYQHLLTKDVLVFGQERRVDWIDCNSGLTACVWTREAEPTTALTGWHASLSFALILVWALLLLTLAPCFYLELRKRA